VYSVCVPGASVRSRASINPSIDQRRVVRACGVQYRHLADPIAARYRRFDSGGRVGTSQRPRFTGLDEDVGAKPAAKSVKVDDTVSGDTAVALEQGDPLAEADFHMAYGLYDQAADLVRLAVAREPQRRDLKLKLLEVFFVWGNKDQFLPLARELANSRAESLPGEWEKIIIMGRQIAPEDALFSTGGALPGAASAGVDLNHEGGQNRVDFDLLGEPTIAPVNSDGIDLDLGAALGDKPAAAETASLSADAGVDFVLDDPDRGADATGSTREMPEAAKPSHTITMELGGFEGDAPTVEQPQLEQIDHPTIRQKLDLHARQGLAAAGDQTAELALDDLGLDLSNRIASGKCRRPVWRAPTVLTNVEEEPASCRRAATAISRCQASRRNCAQRQRT
jgi:Tfp pilus assembly protein FimV